MQIDAVATYLRGQFRGAQVPPPSTTQSGASFKVTTAGGASYQLRLGEPLTDTFDPATLVALLHQVANQMRMCGWGSMVTLLTPAQQAPHCQPMLDADTEKLLQRARLLIDAGEERWDATTGRPVFETSSGQRLNRSHRGVYVWARAAWIRSFEVLRVGICLPHCRLEARPSTLNRA